MDDRKIIVLISGLAVVAISIASIIIFVPRENHTLAANPKPATSPSTHKARDDTPKIDSPTSSPATDSMAIDDANSNFNSEMELCVDSDIVSCQLDFVGGTPTWIDRNQAELLSSKNLFEGNNIPLVYQIKKRYRQQILSAIIDTNIDDFFNGEEEHVLVGYHNGKPGILIRGEACPSVFNSQRTTPRTRMASVVGSILIKSLEESAHDLQPTECKWIGISILIPVKDFGDKEANTSVDCGVMIASLDDCKKIRDNVITDQKFVDSCEIYYSGNDTGKELRRISVTME